MPRQKARLSPAEARVARLAARRQTPTGEREAALDYDDAMRVVAQYKKHHRREVVDSFCQRNFGVTLDELRRQYKPWLRNRR